MLAAVTCSSMLLLGSRRGLLAVVFLPVLAVVDVVLLSSINAMVCFD